MNIKATIDGVEQEFEVVIEGLATHAICVDRTLHAIPCAGAMTFLRLIRPRHTFGQVVYEETGEERCPDHEWVLDHTRSTPHPLYIDWHSGTIQAILRPVEIS